MSIQKYQYRDGLVCSGGVLKRILKVINVTKKIKMPRENVFNS
jgi:hypothetical protein